MSANYRAACRARSKKEFYSKICIVVEEADETEHWLEMMPHRMIMIIQLIQKNLLQMNHHQQKPSHTKRLAGIQPASRYRGSQVLQWTKGKIESQQDKGCQGIF